MSRGIIIGVKRLDYVSKKSGRQVKGYSVCFGEEVKDYVGYVGGDTYMSDEDFSTISAACGGDTKKLINRPVEIIYSRNGVDGIKLLQS